jgi:hypothetical protein
MAETIGIIEMILFSLIIYVIYINYDDMFIRKVPPQLIKKEETIDKPENKEEKFKTQMTCPVMNGSGTNVSRCVHYPPHNTAYIISFCCDKCVSHVQKSLKESDGQYTIVKNEDDILFLKDGIFKQYLLPCSKENLTYISELIGTSI